MSPELLTSAQNPKVKRLLALQKDSSLRREAGIFVVEGRRELGHCLAAGFTVDTVFVCPELCGDGSVNGRGPLARKGQWEGWSKAEVSGKTDPETLPSPTGAESRVKVFEVSKEVYERIAYRGSTEGVIAEVFTRNLSLEDLHLPDNPLIAVLESVEKPGNLGAVLRSADAAGADALLICDPLTDIYNPNVIRASIGAVFTVPTVACTSAEAINWLKRNKIRILTAQLQDSSAYYDCDMRQGTALVMGTESTGLSQAWRAAADAHIRIPMLGRLDSLNVSVSASILLFEAVRQRQA
jgi:TrmH family RNA methyltransferase